MTIEKDKQKLSKATKPNWTLKTIKIDDLKEYYKNPRSLTEKQKNDLKKSLDKYGVIDKPIINQDMILIGGHQRYYVLREFGHKEIECWYPDRMLSDKEVEELNIRLNKNIGDWDFDILANEWEMDDLSNWGFSDKDLGIEVEEEKESDEKISVPKEKDTCPHCGKEID